MKTYRIFQVKFIHSFKLLLYFVFLFFKLCLQYTISCVSLILNIYKTYLRHTQSFLPLYLCTWHSSGVGQVKRGVRIASRDGGVGRGVLPLPYFHLGQLSIQRQAMRVPYMSAHDFVSATNFVLSVCVFTPEQAYMCVCVCVLVCKGVWWSYASASWPEKGPAADC